MKSKIFTVLFIISLISIIPTADAQISIGEKAKQKSVGITISSEGEVKVKHIVKSSNLPVDLELVNGLVSNLKVHDLDGNEILFSMNESKNEVLIQPSNIDFVVEYSLEEVLLETNNTWKWDFRYLETTSFIFPREVDMVFVNERPVLLDEKKGIACHGCQMSLEYSINEPVKFENVKWEDKEFVVQIRSHANIDKLIFDQPSKNISFDIKEENRFVGIIIPLELLWGPYAVFLDDEKIHFQDYINNGTHVWITIKPETSGQVSIIGTTVVPEFSMMIPLIMGFFVILALPFMKKFNLH